MKKTAQTLLAASIILALTACSDSGDLPGKPYEPSPKPPEPVFPSLLDISGKAVKGTLMGATVELFNANDLDTMIKTVQTGADGSYTLSLRDDSGEQISGAYVVKVTADDDSTMICDAAVSCGDVDRGETVPAAALAGLTLSSFTFADSAAEKAPAVNVNSLSTMATDAIISAATLDGSAIDLGNLTQATATDLQIAGSEVVGAIIGVDLSGVDLFSLPIVDASVAEDISTDDSIAATLTLVNGSLSNIDVAIDSTIGASLVNYFVNVETISSAIFGDENVDLGADFSDEMAAINLVQADVSAESDLLLTEINLDLPPEDEVIVEVIPPAVDADEITDIIGDITVGTGATGGS